MTESGRLKRPFRIPPFWSQILIAWMKRLFANSEEIYNALSNLGATLKQTMKFGHFQSSRQCSALGDCQVFQGRLLKQRRPLKQQDSQTLLGFPIVWTIKDEGLHFF